MQLWVDSILAEHQRQPIDLIIVNGDVSLDFWSDGGSYIENQIKETEIFIKGYVSQLPKDVPVVVLPGNHEQYDDVTWLNMTGNARNRVYELGNNLFIMLDLYRVDETHQQEGNGKYTPLTEEEVKKLRTQIEQYSNHNVYIISHYIDMAKQNTADGGAFKTLLEEKDNIIALFAGHTHKSSVLGEGENTYGGKTVAQTGHFSYFTSDFTDADKTIDNFWGFRDLIITADSAYSRYITADCSQYATQLSQYGVASPDGNYGRREIYSVTYYETDGIIYGE